MDGGLPDTNVYAYRNSDHSRNSSEEFRTDGANLEPRGLWSNGTTMWISDSGGDKLFAYRMSNKSHDSGKDIDLDDDNANAKGIWSNGRTIWVADGSSPLIFATTWPTAPAGRN